MPRKIWFFAFFAASGFCSLVYEVIWLRVALAQFGVTTALTSIVLSVFMAGLALGSWAAGRLARNLNGPDALRAYGILELLIGVSAFVVPRELEWGRQLLATQTGAASWGSFGYHLASGASIAVALLPFCVLMGATFPTAMAASRSGPRSESESSFSYLYVANVLGALAGTLASAFVLIELLGFRNTARAAALLNGLVATISILFASNWRLGSPAPSVDAAAAPAPRPHTRGDAGTLWFLFATGLMSLAMEVVWIRQFTPYVGTVVYAFAAVLALYLGGTFLGAHIYRSWSSRGNVGRDGATSFAWACIGVAALLPLAAADPRIPLSFGFLTGVLRLAVGIVPFCAAVGFLTPMLVERWSRGDPARAGAAYALNVLGCIAGPLLAGFVLLPRLSEAWALAILAVPASLAGVLLGPRNSALPAPQASGRNFRSLAAAVIAASAAIAIGSTRSFDSRFPTKVVLRDETATVMAIGTGFERRLLVNGFSMTELTPISKVMAHLPLASLGRPPANGLVVCFGMGTSFRSMLTWGIPTTVVELIPSVPPLFPYYHDDGAELLRRRQARVVIDDGRRFLERTAEQFDVITIDPPPPVEAAGSSLLYSREFYAVAKRRLRPGGILQQWFPGGELFLVVSFTRTLREVFPYVRVFGGIEGFGFHFLASDRPIPVSRADELVARMPVAATADLVEWGPEATAEAQLATMLSHEVPLANILQASPEAPVLVDDRPLNEYFLIRWALIDPSPAGLAFPIGLGGVPVPPG